MRRVTPNVRGRKGGATSDQLTSELLACLVQVMHDVLASEGARTEPSRPLHHAELAGPLGKVRVLLFRAKVGNWRPDYRRRFQSTLDEHGLEIAREMGLCLAAGKPLPATRIKHFARYFIEKATKHQVQFATAKVADFVARCGAASAAAAVAQEDLHKILSYVRGSGLPSDTIVISAGGPRADLFRIAKVSKVSLAGINRHGMSEHLQRQIDGIAARSTWSVGSKRYIPTRNRPHGRETTPGIVVDLGRLRIAAGGLLDELLGAFPVPAQHCSVGLLMRHVSILVTTSDGAIARDSVGQFARRILSTPIVALEGEDAIALMDRLEQRLRKKKQYSARTLDEYLATFFGQIAAGFEQSGRVRPRRVGHAARRFQSPRRGLVSDQPDPHATRAHLRPAIVHVACGSAEKARTRAIEHLEERLARIDAACDREIEAFVEWRAFLHEALNKPGLPDSEQFATAVMRHGGDVTAPYRLWLRKGDLVDIFARVMAAVIRSGAYKDAEYRGLRAKGQAVRFSEAYPRLCRRFPFLKHWARAGRKGPWLTWIPLSHWYVPRAVQLAIELKLQIAMAWNRDTVRNLEAVGIDIASGQLRSLKMKTGQTQYGSIEAEGHTLRTSLALMLEHDRNVTTYWPREHPGLFVAPIARKGRFVFGTPVDNKLLSKFIQWHKLPVFTREQLRNQEAATRYLKNQDPHEIQGLLGHRSLTTTTGYLQHTVIAVLNRANIATFQRQLAASIVWAIEGRDAVPKRGLSDKDINQRLLFPVSDRVSESEWMSPACDVWASNPALPLRIDPLRVAHMKRQRRFYSENWQRLRAEHPEQFEAIHRPRIEFTAALWAVVSDSPYAHLLGAT